MKMASWFPLRIKEAVVPAGHSLPTQPLKAPDLRRLAKHQCVSQNSNSSTVPIRLTLITSQDSARTIKPGDVRVAGWTGLGTLSKTKES